MLISETRLGALCTYIFYVEHNFLYLQKYLSVIFIKFLLFKLFNLLKVILIKETTSMFKRSINNTIVNVNLKEHNLVSCIRLLP